MSVTRRAALCFLLASTLGCFLWRRERAPDAPVRVELNTASLRHIEKLPGITPSMARRIVEGRPYQDVDDLVDRGILTRHEFERVIDDVTVQSKNP